ncbi:hypothetical protein Sjap_005933 [Stephania japonica]|uniref:50S ribosomal protein L19, chloroplastic n=1 Tax=Stephania japonica TaxID=461633 RepID=A0AAP0K632_9MAGN
MASTALSQAFVTISGASLAPSSSNKLGLPTTLSLRPNSTVALSRGFRSAIAPIAAPRHRTSSIVRAESNPDATPEDDGALEEEPEVVEEEGAVAVAERKPIVKLGDIMGILNKRAVEAAVTERPTPEIRTGDVVEIKLVFAFVALVLLLLEFGLQRLELLILLIGFQEVPENRRRVSIYKGIVMSKQNAGIHTTIRIRRIIAGIGVEIVFPVYSPNIKEIKVVAHKKVRRARLYYLRDKLPRFSTFK